MLYDVSFITCGNFPKFSRLLASAFSSFFRQHAAPFNWFEKLGKSLKMLVNCPICSEILLPSDVLFSTPCGHIFHMFCLNRWISRWEISSIFLSLFISYDDLNSICKNYLASNSTCPQCRQECSQNNIHRIYLPEVNFQDQDALIERMNDINRQKIEYESKLKKIEQEKKSLESDLKKKKKEFHKIVQRSKNIIKKGWTRGDFPFHLQSTTFSSLS